jgi:sterol desaturase/sphingolipid hydroxylase (fatty acid hydroxylase superfamily)
MARRAKSREGIPYPLQPPPGIELHREARIARRRFYPVTVLYSAYAVWVWWMGLRAGAASAVAAAAVAVVAWTLVEYLVHRYVLHGRFPDGPGSWRRLLHALFDSSHLEHHERPWDGRHINGRFDTVPFALALVLGASLTPAPAAPVFVATLLACYVSEEWIHYAVHFHPIDNRYFRNLRRHHLFHHGRRGRDVAFGLTSALWDVPFGTGHDTARQLVERSNDGVKDSLRPLPTR